MNRRRKDLDGLDTSLWPRIDMNALSPEQRMIVAKRQRAVEQYIAGEAVRSIETQTGINRHQLYFLLDRCLANDSDGRIVGSGLVEFALLRIKSFTCRVCRAE